MNSLLSKPAALAFLSAVFLNAFVDLGHKIVIQNTIFKMHDGSDQLILTAIVNALILLPFILLFSPSGFCSDRYAKHRVMQLSAWLALGLTACITVFYMLAWFWAALAMTFLLAVQSAFYSPAKYAYIRGFFGKEKLASANGIVSATSIVAILAGTVAFSLFFETLFPAEAQNKNEIVASLTPIGLVLMLCAGLELVLMYQLPNVDGFQDHAIKSRPSSKTLFSASRLRNSLKPVLNHEIIFLCIIGLAMFWSVGQVMLAAFPAFAKEITGDANTVPIQLVIAASGVGIAVGSILASRVSKNYIETGLIPVGALGIALGLFIIPFVEQLLFMGLGFFFIGLMGGLFLVPLNALIQYHAKEHELGKVLAGNNLIQNIAMLAFLVVTVVFASAGLSSKQLLIFTAMFAAAGGAYTVYKLPQSLMRIILSTLMSQRYRMNVQGMKNIPNQGGVLLLGNHISWIDWAVVQLACPRPVQFVMLKSIYERWYLNWFFKLFGCVPIEQGRGSKASLETVASLLDNGKVVCLFPEGSISRTGQLGEFRRGFERAAECADKDFVVVPFYLRGLWGSHWSRSSEKFKQANKKGLSKRDLIVAFGKPEPKTVLAPEVKQRVFDLSISSWQLHVESLPNLAKAWITSSKQRMGQLAIADTSSTNMSTTTSLTVAKSFAKRIKRISPEQNVGILLPTSAGAVLTNMASLMLGKTVVNLNFSASVSALESAIEQAELNTIYTSSRFLKKLKAKGVQLDDILEKVNVILLEDFKEDISKFEYIKNWLMVRLLPAWVLRLTLCKNVNNDTCAAILFSSGSEGAPKGVKLSHKNIMANLKQISEVLNMREDDAVMASLPLFHAFGLTVTQFMPLIEGMPMVCHPDPTDALGISRAVAKHNVSIMFGTSTFLRLYCRNSKIHPLMLSSLRFVVAGAERLKPEVHTAFLQKFGISILEGYGATETTPVAAVNVPDALDFNSWKPQVGTKSGTVGLPLPGTSFKIVDPETFEALETSQDGMILIGGAQVMLGYLANEEKTREVIKELDGQRWYITGDKGHIDADGFLSIVDRYSRFAKLGGEMVSLSAVEQKVVQAMRNQQAELEVVAINLSDEKKGEKIVLLTEIDIELSDLKQAMLQENANPLMLPSEIIVVAALPKLGSGKTDFTLAKKMAIETS